MMTDAEALAALRDKLNRQRTVETLTTGDLIECPDGTTRTVNAISEHHNGTYSITFRGDAYVRRGETEHALFYLAG